MGVHVGIAFGAVVVAGMLTGLIAGALGEAFKRHRPIGRGELVGKLATITTGRVDERFGPGQPARRRRQPDRRRPLRHPNALVRHTRVVLVSYDGAAHYYMVEPFRIEGQYRPPVTTAARVRGTLIA